jgi:signal transduction histidine kinase
MSTPDASTDGTNRSGDWKTDVMSALVDRLPELGLGLLRVLPGGRIDDADAGAVRITGRSADELRTLADVAILLSPEERHVRTAQRDRIRRGEQPDRTFRTVVLRPDGERRPVDTVMLPHVGGGPATIVMRDSSDVAVRDQVIDWYGALVERMPLGVTILDARGVTDPREILVWSANATASVAAGRDLTALVGQKVVDVFPDGHTFDEARRALAIVGTDRTEFLMDLVVGDPDQPTAVYRRAVVALPDGGLALLLDDITHERVEDLRIRHLTERMVQLSDTERRRIAMGLHDDPLQQIAAAALLVSQQRRRDDHTDPARTDRLTMIDDALRSAMTAMRQVVFELSPPELEESGLDSALRRAADHLFGNTDVEVAVSCVLPAEPNARTQGTAFRIAAEALTNVRKHAGASRVEARIGLDDGDLVIEVTDDGSGISGDTPLGHLGLRAMHDRAAAVGGSCTVSDAAPGTRVLARLPLDHVPTTEHVGRAAPDPDPPELDSIAASLRMERDSLRVAEAAASIAAADARRRLDAVASLASILRRAPADPAERARLAVVHLAEVVGDGASIRLIDEARNVMTSIASHHRHAEQGAWLRRYLLVERPPDAGWVGTMLTTGEPMVLDIARLSWLPSLGEVPPPPPHPLRTVLLVPLHVGGPPVGVLGIMRDITPEGFTTDDVHWVSAMADLVIGAMRV